MPEIKQDIRKATFIVAANDSLHKNMADYVCDGIDDHVEIQAALDALPATGGEVFLLDGTYNIESSLVLDSYQTLRGCGRNTVLTTTTDDVDIITATGSDGSEKVGILIADLRIDGKAGGASSQHCIYWQYVDYSRISGVWAENGEGTMGTGTGIMLIFYCDYNHIEGNFINSNAGAGIDVLLGSCNNTIADNTCQSNGLDGIGVEADSDNNAIVGNTCQSNSLCGIVIGGSHSNVVTGNTCRRNDIGIQLTNISMDGECISTNNTITGNTCSENISHGIRLVGDSSKNTVIGNSCQKNGENGLGLDYCHNNIVAGNACILNSQNGDATYDNIILSGGDYNLIASNICRAPSIGTTLTTGESAGATDIHVTTTLGFEVGMGVVIDLGGGNEEYHRIVAITHGAPGVITIDAGLTNNQGVGETIDVPEARYGINISGASSDHNMVEGNNLYDSGRTGDLNDAGANTHMRDNLSNAGAWLADV